MTDTPTQSPERQARDKRLMHEAVFGAANQLTWAKVSVADVVSILADLAAAEARAAKAESGWAEMDAWGVDVMDVALTERSAAELKYKEMALRSAALPGNPTGLAAAPARCTPSTTAKR